jgi:hypothetical protein
MRTDIDWDKEKARIEDITLPEIIKRTSNPNLLNIVVGMSRPGASLFSSRLEYENYPPGTKFNEAFQFYIITWFEIPWIVISIPIEDKPKAEVLLDELKLNLVDGVPTMLGGIKSEQFPINHKNTFAIENRKDHPIHTGEITAQEFLKKESIECEKIFSSYLQPC